MEGDRADHALDLVLSPPVRQYPTIQTVEQSVRMIEERGLDYAVGGEKEAESEKNRLREIPPPCLALLVLPFPVVREAVVGPHEKDESTVDEQVQESGRFYGEGEADCHRRLADPGAR